MAKGIIYPKGASKAPFAYLSKRAARQLLGVHVFQQLGSSCGAAATTGNYTLLDKPFLTRAASIARANKLQLVGITNRCGYAILSRGWDWVSRGNFVC